MTTLPVKHLQVRHRVIRLLMTTPHPPAAPSPLPRGEGNLREVAFSPPRGEKVPKADEGCFLSMLTLRMTVGGRRRT